MTAATGLQACGSLQGRTRSLLRTCHWRAVFSPPVVATRTRPLPPSPLCPLGSGRPLPLGSQQWEMPEFQNDLIRAPGLRLGNRPTPVWPCASMLCGHLTQTQFVGLSGRWSCVELDGGQVGMPRECCVFCVVFTEVCGVLVPPVGSWRDTIIEGSGPFKRFWVTLPPPDSEHTP